MGMSACIQVATLCVQVLGLIGLFWYVTETMKIRRASQQQVQTSLDLIKAATDQVEGMSKPCVMFLGELRDGVDAILDRHGATGNIITAADGGNYIVLNIGNGVALNVRYHFTRPPGVSARGDWRYIPHIFPAQKVTLVEMLKSYNDEHEVKFEYKSIGGRNRSTIQL